MKCIPRTGAGSPVTDLFNIANPNGTSTDDARVKYGICGTELGVTGAGFLQIAPLQSGPADNTGRTQFIGRTTRSEAGALVGHVTDPVGRPTGLGRGLVVARSITTQSAIALLSGFDNTVAADCGGNRGDRQCPQEHKPHQDQSRIVPEMGS